MFEQNQSLKAKKPEIHYRKIFLDCQHGVKRFERLVKAYVHQVTEGV